jgi:hypothetical protein
MEETTVSVNIDAVLDNYLAAALWSTVNDAAIGSDGTLLDNDEPEFLDGKYDFTDFSKDAKEQSLGDIEKFIAEAGDLLDGLDDDMIGHDIWLTRNRHGAGFWDRGYGEIGDKLTDLAQDLGEVNLYGHNGKVHIG